MVHSQVLEPGDIGEEGDLPEFFTSRSAVACFVLEVVDAQDVYIVRFHRVLVGAGGLQRAEKVLGNSRLPS